MNSSPQNPALPTWLFIVADVAAIALAIAIAVWAPHPLSANTVFAIVACVGIGAIAGLIPLVARYERQKNEMLDERQRELEALARTIASSAEQISIATKGFHDVADLAQKNLRLSEHLPHKLQEKIAEFQAQLATAADAEKEELERELLALRTTESERLETVSQRIAKSSAEWAKLEAATHQHLNAANEAVSKLAFGTAAAIGKAQAAAEQALAQARVEAARSLGETSGHATRTIEAAKAAALADFDARLAAAATLLAERGTSHGGGTTLGAAAPVATEVSSSDSAATGTAPESNPDPASASDAPKPAETNSSVPIAAPPKRPRKVRREEMPAAAPGEHVAAAAVPTAAQTAKPPNPAPTAGQEEPLPVPAHTIPEITPVAPPTAEPFSGHIATVANGSSSPVPAAPPKDTSMPPDAAARKRAPRKAGSHEEPGLGLELDDSTRGFATEAAERVRSSDGATRLLVTAYIGIGNRLFIRGEGPGLSWEKGVPLQFVSIGKWRWETNDANAPVKYKLYKNDDLECAALGAQSLDAGHQQEVTAAF